MNEDKVRELISIQLKDLIEEVHLLRSKVDQLQEMVFSKEQGPNQLMTVSNSKALINKAVQMACDVVYDQVIGDINEKIVPQLDKAMNWVSYSIEDGSETTDKFRRKVDAVYANDGSRALTDGKKDERNITEHMRLFFADND
jgi:hypothetical protein